MVQVSYPGPYILEVPSGAHAITGVSTSIAAFFGRSERGPINRAVRVLDRSSLARTFGGPHPNSDLIASVGQFFDNGGTDCYVIRVAHEAKASKLVLQSYDSVDVLTVEALDAGAWANMLRLEIDYNTATPDDTFNLRVLQVDDDERVIASETFTALTMDESLPRFAPDFVNQGSRLVSLTSEAPAPTGTGFSQSRRPISVSNANNLSMGKRLTDILATANRFEMSIDGGAFRTYDLSNASFVDNANPNGFLEDENAIATVIQDELDSQFPAGAKVKVTWDTLDGDFRLLRFDSDTTDKLSVQIRRSGNRDLAAPLMLGIDQGGYEQSVFGALRPAPTGTLLNGDINNLAKLPQNAFDTITIAGHKIDLNTGGKNILETTGPTDAWYVDASNPIPDHNDGVREKLQILARAINSQPADLPTGQQVRAEVWGYRLALIPTSGKANTEIDILTSASAGGGTDIAPDFEMNVRRYALDGSNSSPFQSNVTQAGTDDDGHPPDFNDYSGDQNQGTGFYALDSVDMFNLMVIPADKEVDEVLRLQVEARGSIYCTEHRAFMLVDAPANWQDPDTHRLTATASDVNGLRALFVARNSAVYFPRIVVNDRGRRKTMGACGAVAGVMARIDATRGVWKAPAGTEADVRGILDLESNLSDREQGILNKVGANALRKFPSGFVVWGARTLAGTDDDPNEWKYVPIRRFALFLEESLYRGTRWIVFEPNDEPLWANIRKNIRAFMLGLFRQGAFQGSTPEQAFYVKCDQETTTATDRLLGIVNIEIGFAPLKPAEFVVLKIQQIADDIE